MYHLTKWVIALLGLKDSNPVSTPASGPLLRSPDSPPRAEDWNYRSAVGLMMYIANNSRPDIAFAVNQVARYANNLRCCYEVAVKQIGRYLKGSLFNDHDGNEQTRGTIFKPPDRSEPLQVNLWADADFAGAWSITEQRDPDTARS